ncbi:metal ABC transporter ATPase (plasmid) [Bacillus cereus]|uniref:metal ABC transporter ATPase n=1 Tax=Bacillus cereus TaxID=1396 RepID=UPI001F2D686A|nr:metal ABC transporter ATPase [Bacillus cereus]UIJ69766.1 metal ABC transporter ATPase [Bacillus cereus]
MHGAVTKFIIMKRVDRKLGKYDIKLVHFIPGRIRLQSAEWKVNDILLENIIKQSQAQPFLFPVQSTKETRSLIITYDTIFCTQKEANFLNIQKLTSF